jgi:hypothetical protein
MASMPLHPSAMILRRRELCLLKYISFSYSLQRKSLTSFERSTDTKSPTESIMVSFNLISTLSVLGAQLVSAHFIVNIPAPLGNNIENEDTAPCGGFTPSGSDERTNFHVGGDAIGITTLHAQSFLAYRGMLGSSLSSPNWTVLIPTLQQFGLNNFCEPSIRVPSSWVGQSGLLQIIQDAEDGVHYQVFTALPSPDILHGATRRKHTSSGTL